MGVGVRVMTS